MPTTTAPFFLIAIGFTWALQLPVVLAQRGVISTPVEALMGVAALGGFGPLVGALFTARTDPGGIRGLFRRAFTLGTAKRWVLLSLLLLPAIYLVGRTVAAPFHVDARWLYPPENAQHVMVMLLLPFVEELGWRGVAQPRLQRRYGALTATALVGAGWALWHVMMFLAVTTSPLLFTVSIVNILAGAVVFSWVFNKTRGSLLVAVLLHVGAHLNNPAHATTLAPMVIYTAAIVVVAALMLADRASWPGPQSAQTRLA
jgi:uncharacterized protein